MPEMQVWSLAREDPGEGNGYQRQYFCLENSMDGEAWSATVPGVAKGWTQLSDWRATIYTPFNCKMLTSNNRIYLESTIGSNSNRIASR